MKELYFKRIYFFSPIKICQYADILTKCGKDMFEKYGLKHWKNCFFKNLLIVAYGTLKNKVYIGYSDRHYCCAFQYKTIKNSKSIHFSKLCTIPYFSSRGFGTMCIKYLENVARSMSFLKLTCDVYDKSEKAISFYKNKEFVVIGTKKTLKYSELVLSKEITI